MVAGFAFVERAPLECVRAAGLLCVLRIVGGGGTVAAFVQGQVIDSGPLAADRVSVSLDDIAIRYDESTRRGGAVGASLPKGF